MQVNKPNDYDVAAWLDLYAANPGMHRSVGADGDNGDGGDGDAGAAGDDGGDGGGSADGGDDWRKVFAGGDEKRFNQLQRFVKPDDFGKAYFEAQERIRSGDLLKPLPKDATEEDIKHYRQQLGIPEDPKGYLENLPEGMVIGEDDLPVIEFFANELHNKNVAPDVMHSIINTYDKFMTEAVEARDQADRELAEEIEEQLRDEWGSDYRVNKNLIAAQMKRSFGEQGEEFMKARMPDGTPLMSSPAFLKGMIELARLMNPAGTLIDPNLDPNTSLDDEIKKIETFMRTNRSEYDKDGAMQDRLRKLYEARIERDKRGQAA